MFTLDYLERTQILEAFLSAFTLLNVRIIDLQAFLQIALCHKEATNLKDPRILSGGKNALPHNSNDIGVLCLTAVFKLIGAGGKIARLLA